MESFSAHPGPALFDFAAPNESAMGDDGLVFERRFTTAGADPFDQVTWRKRDVAIYGPGGETVFEQKDVEVPEAWSATAANVVVSKYFRGATGSPERETSVRQLVGRVADTLGRWGEEAGTFAAGSAEVFRAELTHVLVHQMACFNSPVWFNVGLEDAPQCSACFINSVEDTMTSILDLAKTEGMLFKYGSGAGSNLSPIRSSREGLSGGGTASGPVSFMRGFDAFAGVIKSGGKTRRAAKMVILDVDHPDIEDFILCKELEEKKAQALIEAGYSGDFDIAGSAYDGLFYQNANHTVRVSDDFMQAVADDGDWTTHAVTDKRPVDTFKARDLMKKIAHAAWVCGDPGIQFDTTINAWHTCPESGRINASNPCSEYMFLNDTACNLASVNLLAFLDRRSDGRPLFDVAGFRHVCELMTTAQEVIVDRAGYPTPRIRDNSRRYRPLGLGYSNLGALLMACALPYDSEAGRATAAAVTALLTGTAYAQSARLAAVHGPFAAFARNREPMLGVLERHREALAEVEASTVLPEVLKAAREVWDEALESAAEDGLRNAQISVLAPTGTIAFMMDCDTTGVEPDIALVKYKKMVGGGMMKMLNRTVPLALERLGYDEAHRRAILDHLEESDTIEGAPGLQDEHLPVFDCALRPQNGRRSIHYEGHLKMLAAVQPFLSGAISKTINLPPDVTPEEIEEVYVEAWKLGLKAVAVYRDGCKQSQPLSTRGEKKKAAPAQGGAARRRLPDERQALTHKFAIDQHEGYITVGLYDDGQPGEIFLVMAKEGSTISGLMDVFATAVSIALQYGVPLKTLVDKFSHTRFEPSGFTKNPRIPIAKSVVDYIFRWLASKFMDADEQASAGLVSQEASSGETSAVPLEVKRSNGSAAPAAFLSQQDAPACHVCGSIMVRCGTCYECTNCGATSGCS